MTLANPETPFSGMVYVVDDDDELAELFSLLLDSVSLPHKRFASGEEFLAGVPAGDWGCVILDLRMPGMGGMAVLRHLRERRSTLSVIVVTGHGEIRSAVEAIQWGAINFLEKPFSNEELLANVHRALADSRNRHAQGTRLRDLQRKFENLSVRERQVASLVSRGLTSKEVAEELGISARTVEVHRAHILEQLECESSVEIARLIVELEHARN
jgi:RNA polymerase sigma factor (sigma-70 family)